MEYNTDTFVDQVRNVAHVPQGNNTFSFNQFLQLGDMQMRTLVAPKIAACRENYWLTTVEYPTVPAINKYAIPSKAQGSAIVDVKVNIGVNFVHLVRLEVSDLYSEQYSAIGGYGYYLEDQYVRLIPTTLTGLVTMWYYRIPSKLVATTACARITAIDFGTSTVTVGTVPSSFIGADIEFDIVSAKPGFNVLKKDSLATINSPDITFDALPVDLKVGDYVCLAGESCVIQCPLEWYETLVQAVVVKIYEIQGYERKMALAAAVLKDMVDNTTNLVSPRTVSNAKVIYGGGSLLFPKGQTWLPIRRE